MMARLLQNYAEATYPADDFIAHSPQPTHKPDAWALEYASKLERRLELGRHVDESTWRWLQRSDQLPRLAFWFELLHRADADGVCQANTLSTWKFFETGQQRRRLLKNLEQRGLIKRLTEHPEYKVQVTA